jgi:hypothetical protein
LPDFAEILTGQPHGDIGQEPHQAKQAEPPPRFGNRIFPHAVEIFSVDDTEFVRIGVGQVPIQG